MWLLWLGVIGTFAPGGVALGASAVSLDSPWLEIETFLFVVFFVGYVVLRSGSGNLNRGISGIAA